MSAEYKYIDGTLRAGHFCSNCGQTVNMIGTGHVEGFTPEWPRMTIWKCQSNRELVEKLYRANSLNKDISK